ncbi:MAG: hypothetical protein MUO28_05355 [Desulfobacterales bacterium]|nr:hypothetical protein [Desulfobacterales bacterium]
MTRKILVPWAMLERGKEVLKKSKSEVCYLHGPKGELPTLKELIQAVRQADVLPPRGTQPVPQEVILSNPKHIVNPEVFESPVYPRKLRS